MTMDIFFNETFHIPIISFCMGYPKFSLYFSIGVIQFCSNFIKYNYKKIIYTMYIFSLLFSVAFALHLGKETQAHVH